jgi:hypothetical protein
VQAHLFFRLRILSLSRLALPSLLVLLGGLQGCLNTRFH